MARELLFLSAPRMPLKSRPNLFLTLALTLGLNALLGPAWAGEAGKKAPGKVSSGDKPEAEGYGERLQRLKSLVDSGRSFEARRQAQELERFSIVRFGEQSGYTAKARDLLSMVNADALHVVSALRLKEALLAVASKYEDPGGRGHTVITSIRVQLALMRAEVGEAVVAEKDMRVALAAETGWKHTVNPNVPMIHFTLAHALGAQGRFAEAISACQEGLSRIREDDTNEVRGMNVDGLGELAALLSRADRCEEAERFFARAIELAHSLKDPEKTLFDLELVRAENRFESGQRAEALAQMKKRLEESIARAGEDETRTLKARLDYAYYLNQTPGGQAEALRESEKLMRVARAEIHEECILTLNLKNNYYECLASNGRLEEALAGHRQVIQLREQMLGFNHLHVLESRHQIASTLFALGQVEKARGHATRALQGLEKLLGPDHRYTRRTRDLLGRMPVVAQ